MFRCPLCHNDYDVGDYATHATNDHGGGTPRPQANGQTITDYRYVINNPINVPTSSSSVPGVASVNNVDLISKLRIDRSNYGAIRTTNFCYGANCSDYGIFIIFEGMKTKFGIDFDKTQFIVDFAVHLVGCNGSEKQDGGVKLLPDRSSTQAVKEQLVQWSAIYSCWKSTAAEHGETDMTMRKFYCNGGICSELVSLYKTSSVFNFERQFGTVFSNSADIQMSEFYWAIPKLIHRQGLSAETDRTKKCIKVAQGNVQSELKSEDPASNVFDPDMKRIGKVLRPTTSVSPAEALSARFLLQKLANSTK